MPFTVGETPSVADILASGRPDAANQRRRPPAWLLLLVVAAVLVGGQAWRDRGPEPEAGPSPPPSGTATAGPSESQGPTGAAARFRLDGRLGVGPTGVQLLVGGPQPVIVDAGTGRAAPLPGVPRLRAGQTAQLQRVATATVAVIRDHDYGLVEAFVVPDGGRTFSVGPAEGVVQAVDGGLLAYDSGSNGRPGWLASLGARGQVRWRRPLSLLTLVLGDTPHGLLVETTPDPEHGGALELIDPRTGRLKRGLGRAQYVLASTPEAVAWAPAGCADQCQLMVTSLANGGSRLYDTPDYRLPGYAAFSPDQRRLALSFYGLHDFLPGLDRDGFVTQLDLHSGTMQTIPGLTTEAKSAATLAWSPTGNWLAMGVRTPGPDYRDRLVLWRPSEAGLTVLPPLLPPESSAAGLIVLSGPGRP